MIHAGASVGSHEFAQGEGPDALVGVVLDAERIGEEFSIGAGQLAVLGDDDDLGGGGGDFAFAILFGGDDGAGIAGGFAFEPSADDRRFGDEKRHSLTLHVGSHEGAVGVIVFKERDEAGGDGDELLGADVHVAGFLGLDFEEVAAETDRDLFIHEGSVRIEHVVGLGDLVGLLLVGGEVFQFILDDAVVDLPVWRFDEAEIVDAGEGGHRVDEADVRTFWGLDGADASVVRRMHVADFEAGAVAVQTAWPKSGEAAFVGELGQRVDLVHELRELGATEEITHHGGERLGVDEFLWGHAFEVHIEEGHALFDEALSAGEAHAALV